MLMFISFPVIADDRVKVGFAGSFLNLIERQPTLSRQDV